MREQVVELEDDPDLAPKAAQPALARHRPRLKVNAVDRDAPVLEGIERNDGAKDARLAAAREPHQRHPLTLPDLEVDPAKHGLAAAREVEVGDGEDRLVHCSDTFHFRSSRLARRESGSDIAR